MWVTCNVCMGEGVIHTVHEVYDNTICKKKCKKKCKICNPENGYLEEHRIYYRGHIWVEANFDPISPPNSPR